MSRTASERVRILNAEPAGYAAEARAILETLGDVVEQEVAPGALVEAAEGFDVVIVRLGHRLDSDFFDRLGVGTGGRLRAVVTATTGLDHVDTNAAEAAGVAVLALRGETDFLRTVTATAEHAWGLLLALVRRLPEAIRAGAAADWDRDRFRGHELRGRRLAILGLGRLGEMTARYGLAFGMRVSAHDPYREARGEGWVEGVERRDSAAALMADADVLSIHLPLNEETRGAVDADLLARLPDGAVVINTARGGVIDGAALAAEVASGRLGGAAVDVVGGETDPGGIAADPLVRLASTHPRMIVTPHIGGATIESMSRTEIFMAEKLVRHWTGASSDGPAS